MMPPEKRWNELVLRFGMEDVIVELFLEEKEEDEETKYIQQEVLSLLDSYIDSTKRF